MVIRSSTRTLVAAVVAVSMVGTSSAVTFQGPSTWTKKQKIAAAGVATLAVGTALAVYAYQNPESALGVTTRTMATTLGGWLQAARGLFTSAPAQELVATAGNAAAQAPKALVEATSSVVAPVVQEIAQPATLIAQETPKAMVATVQKTLPAATQAWVDSWKTTPTYVGRVVAKKAAVQAPKALVEAAKSRDWHIPAVRNFVQVMRNQFRK